MSEMVERVARALVVLEPRQNDPSPSWILERNIRLARAAIAAMREPTETMVFSAESSGRTWDDVRANWRAMIDEALRE